jgi:hypothetical protein
MERRYRREKTANGIENGNGDCGVWKFDEVK